MIQRLFGLSAACCRFGDLILALLLVAIVGLLIIPLPTAIVDGLIAVNLMISTILLMLSLYLPRALAFSTFPSMLLFTTLFRLALNVTTTRLILLHADAGAIIETFGNFVVGGNFAVGAVIFLIITVVQFVVITKGSERVSEVAARFTLDAMPGKQMSIDADMRAGAITMEQARERRAELAAESQLYGAMDGAMKFVKGDAIAGLIITLINLIGGFCIGVFMNDWDIGKSIRVYAILTIGDGLVSQIPALLVSITSGVIVTRVGTANAAPLGREIIGQIFAQPKALCLGALVLAVLGCIPGFPKLSLFGLATFTFLLGCGLHARQRAGTDSTDGGTPSATPTADTPESYALVTPLLIECAEDTRALEGFDTLMPRLNALRRQLFYALGVPFPMPHLRFHETLAPHHYRVLIHEVPVASGTFAETNAVDSFVESLSATLKRNAADFLSLQETRLLLDTLERDAPELAREVQRVLPIQRLTDVLQRLVQEEIGVRDLRRITQTLIDWGQREKDPILLSEYVRGALTRYISHKFADAQGMLAAYLLDPALEEELRQAVRQTSGGSYLALEPDAVRRLLRRLRQLIGETPPTACRPVVVVSVDIRRYFRKLIERDFADLPVLSYQELSPEITLQPLGHLRRSGDTEQTAAFSAAA